MAASKSASYPPAANGTPRSRTAASKPPSLQDKLLGPRGLAAFTIDTGPLAASTPERAEPGLSTSPKGRKPKPAKWPTLEFRFYALVFLIMVPIMVWVPVRLSQPSDPNYPRYSGHLRPGWIAGRLRDDSDFQYRSFRDYVLPLFAIMAVYLLISAAFSRMRNFASSGYQRLTQPGSLPQNNNRVPFLLTFTTIFIAALHGANAFKLIAVLSANYALANALGGTRLAPPVIWVFNVGVLFAVHWNDGFKYAELWSQLEPLDKYQGLLPRWQINFNITMLRLVSYSMDLHWARQAAASPSTDRAQARSAYSHSSDGEPNPRERCSISRPFEEYSFVNYLIYALYPPLFIAGPIMTFNDFTWQLYRPGKIPIRSVLTYGFRFLMSLFTMELILHFIYVNAIKDSKAWDGATPMELSMIGFWNLIVVWLKLLIPWRFFRLWAMADGVDAPENMVRCMANNYSTLGFWRSWHRSYNLWIIRYIYVPLGGGRNRIVSTLLVFTFVALWHDLSLKLLTWGWLVTFFIVPEVACWALLPESKYGHHGWYRHVCAAGGVLNVLMMMSANLVGFAIGTDGMKYMLEQLLGSWHGARFMLAACAVLFVGVQFMFEYREEELRRGIDRKC